MEDSENKSEFKVTDKRRFTTEGQTTPDDQPEAPKEAEVRAEEQPTSEAPSEKREAAEKKEETYRPLDFNSFVMSMANTALFQLGLIQLPDSESMKDITGARQTIDLLALIQDKTRGNLSDQEQKLLDETLFQLRMAFVEAAK
jgi:hypothetical protein